MIGTVGSELLKVWESAQNNPPTFYYSRFFDDTSDVFARSRDYFSCAGLVLMTANNDNESNSRSESSGGNYRQLVIVEQFRGNFLFFQLNLREKAEEGECEELTAITLSCQKKVRNSFCMDLKSLNCVCCCHIVIPIHP